MENLSDIKSAIDGLGRDWHEYCETNDKRLAEVEKKGGADPLLADKLSKLDQRFDRIETAFKRSPRGDTETKAEDTPETKAFWSYCRKGDKHIEAEEKKALTLGDSTQAGFLAPREFVNEIIKGEIEFSPIRAVARVRTTGKSSMQLPKRTGTFAALWTAEAGTRSETEGLTYGLEELPNHELYALVDVSNQMLEDADFNLQQELQDEFSEQFGVAEGTAFITGDGAGKPGGILDNAALGETVSGNASTLTADGLIDLYHAIKSAYARNASWLLNRTSLGAIRKLKDSNNQYLWMPGLAGLRPSTILDAPFIEATDMPDVAANAYPVVFGDFRRGYTITDRVSLSVLMDPYTQATTGKTRFIARRRVGGQVVLAEAIRKLKVSA